MAKASALIEKVEKLKMPIRIAIFAGTLVVLIGIFVWFFYLPFSFGSFTFPRPVKSKKWKKGLLNFRPSSIAPS